MIAFILSLFTLIISLTPLTTKPASPFYVTDPDIVYVTNALSYIKRHQITYTDHPGTPYILTLSAAYTPLRLYAKYIDHTPFIEWSLKNFSFLVTYSRFFACFIFSLGIYIFLSSIKRFTKSNILVLIAWLLLFTYSGFLNFSDRLTPENFLPLIYSVWFYFLLLLIKKPSLKNNILLNLVSGISFATKFTNLSLLIISGLITLYLFLGQKSKKYRYVFLGLLSILLGFIISTWVIKDHYPKLVNWVSGMITHSGLHGGGAKTIFDPIVYKNSILGLIKSEPRISKLFLLTPLLFLTFIRKFNKRKRIIYGFIFISAAITTLLFAKYTLFYYQLPHFFIIVSLFVLILHQLLFVKYKNMNFKFILIILAVILSLPVPERISTHLRIKKDKNIESANFEKFIVDHPPKHMTLWQYGRSKDFSMIWGRSWSGEFYGQELTKIYPCIGEMVGLKYYRSNKPETIPLFDVCWDQLYLQASLVDEFLNNFPEQNLEITKLDSQKLVLITSNHCDTTN